MPSRIMISFMGNMITIFLLLLLCEKVSSRTNANDSQSKTQPTVSTSRKTEVHKSHQGQGHGIKVAKWDFKRVQMPFLISFWILLASLAKIGETFLTFGIVFITVQVYE